jgi:hypothetical protein
LAWSFFGGFGGVVDFVGFAGWLVCPFVGDWVVWVWFCEEFVLWGTESVLCVSLSSFVD